MLVNKAALTENPYLSAGIGYVALHLTLITALNWLFGADPGSLVSNGASSLAYFALITAFGGTLIALSLPRLGRGWWLFAGILLLVLFGGRYAFDSATGVYSLASVFSLVFLPYAVAAGVVARLVLVRLPVARIARIPDRHGSVGALLVVGVLLVGTIGGGIAAVATAPPAVPPADWSADRQLTYLERTDQGDRQTGAMVDRSRDYRRAERVLDLLHAGQAGSPEDWLNAAVVLQHGSCAAHFEIAYHLTTAANESSDVNATRWVHLTYDRWQVAMGNDQRYGTQTGTRRAGEACYPPVPEGLDVSNPLSRTD